MQSNYPETVFAFLGRVSKTSVLYKTKVLVRIIFDYDADAFVKISYRAASPTPEIPIGHFQTI